MNDYLSFLETKKKKFIESGFEVNENELNSNLFDFQKYIVKTAVKNVNKILSKKDQLKIEF